MAPRAPQADALFDELLAQRREDQGAFDAELAARLCGLAWTHAEARFAAGEMESARAYFAATLELEPPPPERLAVLTNLALCELELDKPAAAKDRCAEAVGMAADAGISPGARLHYARFRAAVLIGDFQEAEAAVSDLASAAAGEPEGTAAGVLCLAVADAFAAGDKLIAAGVLEKLVAQAAAAEPAAMGSERAAGQVIVARCCLQLKLQLLAADGGAEGLDSIVTVVRAGVAALGRCSPADIADEAEWLARTAWNTALLAAERGAPEAAAACFEQVGELDRREGGPTPPVARQHACNLMAAAAAVARLEAASASGRHTAPADLFLAREATARCRGAPAPDGELAWLLVELEFRALVASGPEQAGAAAAVLRAAVDQLGTGCARTAAHAHAPSLTGSRPPADANRPGSGRAPRWRTPPGWRRWPARRTGRDWMRTSGSSRPRRIGHRCFRSYPT